LKIILFLLISSCSSQKISEFTKGCLIGLVDNYQRLAQKQWNGEYTETVYLHCQELEARYGKDN